MARWRQIGGSVDLIEKPVIDAPSMYQTWLFVNGDIDDIGHFLCGACKKLLNFTFVHHLYPISWQSHQRTPVDNYINDLGYIHGHPVCTRLRKKFRVCSTDLPLIRIISRLMHIIQWYWCIYVLKNGQNKQVRRSISLY